MPEKFLRMLLTRVRLKKCNKFEYISNEMTNEYYSDVLLSNNDP